MTAPQNAQIVRQDGQLLYGFQLRLLESIFLICFFPITQQAHHILNGRVRQMQ